MNKKNILYAFLFLLVGWQLLMTQSNFNLFHPTYEPFIKDDDSPLRVITYNIQGLPFSSKKVEELGEKLKEYDVVLLQECFTDFYLKKKDLLKTLHTKHDFNVIGETHPDFFSMKYLDSGLAIASKLKIYEHYFQAFKAGSSIDQYSNKGFMYIKVYKNHKPLYIYNIHLQASYKNDVFDSLQTKLDQLKELKENIKKKERVCIGGDFNLDVATEEIKQNVLEQFQNCESYIPDDPTHWVLYLDNIEEDTKCRKCLGYSPYCLDFFITKGVSGKYKGSHPFDGLSDHCAVELNI